VDKEKSQVVLAVKEPARTINFVRNQWSSEKNKYLTIHDSQDIPAADRWILIGKDEGHLFIAILPELVDTVEEAHECLKPDEVKKLRETEYTRQGEWFFLKTNTTYYKNVIKKGTGLSNGKGRAHRVSEMIDFGDKELIEKECVVRGTVSHPEHVNKQFKHWVRAISNTETPVRQIQGVTWYD